MKDKRGMSSLLRFSLTVLALHAGFGCAAIFNTLNVACIHGLKLFFTVVV